MKRQAKKGQIEEIEPASLTAEDFDPEESSKREFRAIRRVYCIICFAAACLVFLMENGMFFVFCQDPEAYGGFQTSIPVYLLQYNIIPSLLNFSAAGAAWLFYKKEIGSDLYQNCVPVAAMAVICSVTAAAHSVYPVVLCVVCLPVFMASIFGNRKLILLVSSYGVAGLLLSALWRTKSPYIPNKMSIMPETVATLLILLLSTVLSLILGRILATQRRRLLMAVMEGKKSAKEAQAANRTKSEFLANMSHEIRTPLNAILGSTEIISRKAVAPVVSECAEDIQRAGNFLLSIINDILDISKIESGNMELEESQYELGSLINDSYTMVESRGKKKGLKMEVVCDPSLPHLLIGDEYHLRQVIVNLLTNAVKYTSSGRVELNAGGEVKDGVLMLTVQVKDTGIGIREEDLEHLFEKFNRLDLKQNRQIEGTGLGLSITRQLVELMNGTIAVDSAYGIGSVFTVTIPQSIADDAPVGDIQSKYISHSTAEEYTRSFAAPDARILVVDDVPMNLQVISRLLEETEIQIDTAPGGAECLELIKQKRYDIILMDQMMPQMDGTETLRAMKNSEESLNKDVPVIMLTADAMVGAREEYLEAGFADYLSKPVRGARLEAMIRKYLPEEKIKTI